MIQLISSYRGFIPRIKKLKLWSSSSEFFLLPGWNLNFKQTLDMKMSLEEEESKRFTEYDVEKVRLIKKIQEWFTSSQRENL